MLIDVRALHLLKWQNKTKQPNVVLSFIFTLQSHVLSA